MLVFDLFFDFECLNMLDDADYESRWCTFMFMFMSASAGPAGSSDQFTTIAVMVCDSHTLMHVPAKCPPKLHRCLRAESIQPSSLSPRVPWTHLTRCCGQEGYWILGVSNVNSGHSRPWESYVDLTYSHFCYLNLTLSYL